MLKATASKKNKLLSLLLRGITILMEIFIRLLLESCLSGKWYLCNEMLKATISTKKKLLSLLLQRDSQIFLRLL
jgi:hypothetical protein